MVGLGTSLVGTSLVGTSLVGTSLAQFAAHVTAECTKASLEDRRWRRRNSN